jgi:hypothetical protein
MLRRHIINDVGVSLWVKREGAALEFGCRRRDPSMTLAQALLRQLISQLVRFSKRGGL